MMLVADAFEYLKISYLVSGSMASTLYGVTRSTIDADLVADIHLDHVEPLVNALGEEFYADAEMIRDAVSHRSSFNLIHLTTMFKIDVFIQKERPFDRLQMTRRISRVFATDPDKRAFISTAEDIILVKLEWFRRGGEISDRQWRDILGVLKVQAGRLDLDYMRKWAVELSVADLLARALKESE
jgi:hypothetical protein